MLDTECYACIEEFQLCRNIAWFWLKQFLLYKIKHVADFSVHHVSQTKTTWDFDALTLFRYYFILFFFNFYIIQIAVYNNNINLVKVLIRLGVNLNTRDKYGLTPLHYGERLTWKINWIKYHFLFKLWSQIMFI